MQFVLLMELLLLLLLLPSSSSLLLSFPVLGFDGSPGMDLPLVSVSLPSVPPSHWLPSFFRDVELALLLLVAYFTELVTAVMHGGRGKGPAMEGGREEGTRQHTRCLRISGPAAAVAIAYQLICCRRR